MSIAGLIVAGGRGSRMGCEKPLISFRGAALIAAVIARAKPQVEALALNVPAASRAAYRQFGLPLLEDALPGSKGPLAGIIAGLDWLPPAYDWLASFPCDTPFLPRDLVEHLAAARRGRQPVVIQAGEEVHALCALWPRNTLSRLQEIVGTGRFVSMRQTLAALEAVHLLMPADNQAFFNINTPEDLAEAERLANLSDPRG